MKDDDDEKHDDQSRADGEWCGVRQDLPRPASGESDRFVKAVYERVCEQMRHADNYVRPETGVLRFVILPTDLNALLKFVADTTGLSAQPPSTNAVDPSAQPSGTLTTRDENSSSSSDESPF